MPASLTEEEFSRHLSTKFRVTGEEPIELELTEVKGYLGQANEHAGMERFSVFFHGMGDHCLPQQIYPVEHDVMGAFDLFLVPIARDERGFCYEAVFNYFK